MLDDIKRESKPEGFDITEIQGYTTKKTGVYHAPLIKPTEIELKDLAYGMANGMTFKPALLDGSKSDSWMQQQIFALDFDHNTTLESELQSAKDLGIEPCFIYTSFGHTAEEHKFRIVFVTDKVITDAYVRNKLQITLIKTFASSDAVNFDETRMFFGGKGKQPYYFNEEARINAESILNSFWKEEYEPFISKGKGSKRKKKPPDQVHNKGLPQKTVLLNQDASYLINIEAIKSLNVDALKNKLNCELYAPAIFKSDSDLYEHISRIDLGDFLGIGGNWVNCILPDHEDSTPSAHIYFTDSGTPVYKCFGCNNTFTIIGIVERLSGCRRSQAIEFIKSIYNLHLEQSDWVIEHKRIMIENANYLDTEEFKIQFPTLSKLIQTRKLHIQKMLIHFTQHISDDLKVDGKPIFYGGYALLMNILGVRNDSKKIAQTLTLFALLNLLEKVDIDKIPEKELKKAKQIAAKYGHKKLTNFYQFQEYGVNHLYDSEEIAKTLKLNNMTLKGLSRDYILRTFGKEKADKVYPQYKYENALGTSEKSNNATIKLATKIMELINQNGYCLEADIRGKGKTEIQWKRSIQDILNSYELVRVKASKANKERYNIPDFVPYQSYVITADIR